MAHTRKTIKWFLFIIPVMLVLCTQAAAADRPIGDEWLLYVPSDRYSRPVYPLSLPTGYTLGKYRYFASGGYAYDNNLWYLAGSFGILDTLDIDLGVMHYYVPSRGGELRYAPALAYSVYQSKDRYVALNVGAGSMLMTNKYTLYTVEPEINTVLSILVNPIFGIHLGVSGHYNITNPETEYWDGVLGIRSIKHISPGDYRIVDKGGMYFDTIFGISDQITRSVAFTGALSYSNLFHRTGYDVDLIFSWFYPVRILIGVDNDIFNFGLYIMS